MEKIAQLDIPDNIHNWIKHFFEERYHSTRYGGESSIAAQIKASIIQGSGLGPASYAVTAADLHSTVPGNRMFKFADDTYLVVPAINSDTRATEITVIEEWARANNLKLNRANSQEMIFSAHGKRGKSVQAPPPIPGIQRVVTLRILGIIVNDKITASEHVAYLLSSCNSLLYALRILRSRGIPEASLQDVFRSIVISKLTYGAPAWSGTCSATDRSRLDKFLRRSKQCGYCDKSVPTISELFETADDKFFNAILSNSAHVLQPYMQERPSAGYALRRRAHTKFLVPKTVHLNEQDFLIRMLYKDCF